MSNCLNCQKEIQNTEGKRPKKFCSDNCRASFHNKNKKKEPKYVLLSTHETEIKKRDDRIRLLEAQISTQGQNEAEVSKNAKIVDFDRKNKPASNIQNFTSDKNTNKVINTEMPVRMEGEDAIDFAIRKNEWKKLQK